MEKMMRKVWKRKRGFTLIELLIVVAIIGILAGIAIPNFLGARTKAKVSKAFADMRSIGNALEMYYVDNNQYPTTPNEVDTALTGGNTVYMSSIPKDPFNSGGSRSSGTGSGDAIADNSYGYATSSSSTFGAAWLLISNGPDADADVGNGSGVTIDFGTNRVSGELGGSDGAYSGYGTDKWYNPASGTTSNGDLGLGGP